MHLRLISEYFSPQEAATGRLLAELVEESLRQSQSLRVSVISGRRPYRARQQSFPALEHGPRLRVLRLARTSWRSKGTLGRVADDLVFTLSAYLSAQAGKRADVTLVTTSPATLPLAALGLLLRRREPYVYLVYDVYPDIAVASGFTGQRSWTVRVFAALQKLMLQRAAAVLVLGDCMTEELGRRYGVKPEKTHVVPNWWRPLYLGQMREKPAAAPLTLTYAGNLGHAQEFTTLLDALPLLPPDTRVEFIGDGERREEIQNHLNADGHGRSTLLPYLSEPELAAHLHTSTDIALVALNPEVSGLAVPSKTYNLLAAGLPLLAIMSESCEIARMIRRSGCGEVVQPGDTGGLQRAIERMRDPVIRRQMATRSRALAAEYTLEGSATRTLEVLEKVAGHRWP